MDRLGVQADHNSCRPRGSSLLQLKNLSTPGPIKLLRYRSCYGESAAINESNPRCVSLRVKASRVAEGKSAEKESEVLAKSHQMSTGFLIAMACVTLLPGCNAFGLRSQLQQLESENSRLLSEFRAERQRREAAELTARQLETRLAESEKLLARQSQDFSTPGRLSSLPGPPFRSDARGQLGDPSSLGNPSEPWDNPQSRLGNPGDFQWQRRSN